MVGPPEHAEEEQVGPVRRVRPAGGPEQHGPVLRLHLRPEGGGNVGRRVGRENAQVSRNQSSRRSAILWGYHPTSMVRTQTCRILSLIAQLSRPRRMVALGPLSDAFFTPL